jgi:hypothetical protein
METARVRYIHMHRSNGRRRKNVPRETWQACGLAAHLCVSVTALPQIMHVLCSFNHVLQHISHAQCLQRGKKLLFFNSIIFKQRVRNAGEMKNRTRLGFTQAHDKNKRNSRLCWSTNNSKLYPHGVRTNNCTCMEPQSAS